MFLRAAAKCQSEWDPASCQTLGNLCVLQMYDESTVACQVYQRMAGLRQGVSAEYSDAPEGLPWLYYGLLNNQDAIAVSRKIPKLDVNIAGGQGVSTLTFVVARYSLEGSFLGIQNLTTQLQ
ncbi:hypothetical protein HK102_000720, partial [Quaeritorhiza haematococci]